MVRISPPSKSRGSTRDVLMLLLGAGIALGLGVVFSVDSVGTVALSASLQQQLGSSTASNSDTPGWNPIHVFYGKMSHILDPIPADEYWADDGPYNERKWFSQHGQDVAVMKILNFQKDGFFVDLASNDAVWASNTFVMEQKFGWKGICIEPNPMYWYRLSFRKCHAVASFVGAKDFDEVQVAMSDRKEIGPFGGIVGADFDNKKNSKTEPRYTASLQGILERFNAPSMIDFLSLDVEGAELFIMKSFPFHKYSFKCLTVERPSEELQMLLTKNGYKFVYQIHKKADSLWVHNSIFDQAKTNLAVRPEEIGERNPKITNAVGS
jgi:hypothetical protein